jgi:hypothetical protein
MVNEGKILGVSFIEILKQHNTCDENKEIKGGNTPKTFKKNPNKKIQKDLEAYWTKENNISYYGDKNYIKADSGSKLIVKFEVIDTFTQDSQVIDNKIDEK